jgi:imidazolonepropionase-like amidohydrolase
VSRIRKTTLAQSLIGCVQHDCARCANAAKARTKVQIITDVIEMVDNRCLAYDGPVGDTREEMTAAEMRRIYKAAKSALRYLKAHAPR